MQPPGDLFDIAPTPLMVVDIEFRYLAANRAYCEALATPVDVMLGRNIFEVFPAPAEQRCQVEGAFHRALSGQIAHIEKIPYTIDGAERWWTASHTPVRDADGCIVGIMQNTHDVSSEVEAERLQQVISEEYDHRVRNIIAKILAMTRATARDATTLPDFLAAFEPRIAALVRTHDLLVRGGWEHLGLADLVTGELAPWASGERISISGENLPLSSRVAQVLGLALHELATNAAKYGALGSPGGHLAVNWQRESGNGPLHLAWTESGVTPRIAERRGFGSTLIDRILPAETGGKVTRTLTPTGLDCRVMIPRP